MKPAIVLMPGTFGTWYSDFFEAAAKYDVAVLGVVSDMSNPVEASYFSEMRSNPDSLLRYVSAWGEAGPDDVDIAVDLISGWSAQYDIVGVYSYTDEYLPVAAFVAELLGFPGPGYMAALVSRNKHLQRRLLPELSPQWVVVPPRKRAEVAEAPPLRFPFICKATSRSGSSGVRRVLNVTEFRRLLASYPAEETLLLEELVEGPEFMVLSVYVGGKVHRQTVTADTVYDEVDFVESGYTVPCSDHKLAERLKTAATRALTQIGMVSGLSHCDFRLTEDGEIRLMEVSVRGAGDAVPTLVKLATGVSDAEILVPLLLGRTAPSSTVVSRVARQLYLPQQPGRLAGVKSTVSSLPVNWFIESLARVPPEPSASDDPAVIHEVLLQKFRMSYVDAITFSDDRAGSVILHAPDQEAADKLTENILRDIQLDIR